MTDRTRKFITGPLMPLSILAAALLVSVVFFLLRTGHVDGRVFFFPTNDGSGIGSERRGIPGRRDTAEELDVFINELFLGPETLALAHTVPRGTRLRHVAVVDKTAYVDLDLRVLDTAGELPISLDEALSNLSYNILYNFNGLEKTVFTIEGSQVDSPYYSEPEAAE